MGLLTSLVVFRGSAPDPAGGSDFPRTPSYRRAAGFSPRLSAALPLIALLLLWGCFESAPAHAHGVYIFAWPEPGRLCSDSYFSKKSRVRGGEVGVYDDTGALLAEGRSDDTGRVCFDAPDRAGDLLFVVRAGQGHRAEFLLPAARVAQALPSGAARPGAETGVRQGGAPADASPAPAAGTSPAPAPAVEASPAPVAFSASGPVAPASPAPVSSAPAFSAPGASAPSSAFSPEVWEARMRALVREELQRELAPLRAGAVESGPDARDILGGLGWIIGLAGLGAWWAARRKGG